MRIGVEEAVAKDHFHPDNRAAPRELLAIHALGVQLRRVVEVDAVEQFHGQHAAGGEVWKDFREANGFVLRKVAGELLEVAFLAAEVELAEERSAELLHDVDGPVAFELVGLFRERRESFQDFQITADARLDAGMLDLHDDAPSIRQPRDVRLANGGGGDGGGLELAEDFLHRVAQLGGHRGQHCFRRVRRNVFLEPGQFSGDFLAYEIRPRAQHLAELDVGGAQLGEREPDAGGARLIRERLASVRGEELLRTVEIGVAEPFDQAMPGENAHHLAEAAGVAGQHGQMMKFHSNVGEFTPSASATDRRPVPDVCQAR